MRRPRRLVATLGAGLLLSGCSGVVQVEVPTLSAADASTCEDFTADLPDTFAEQAPVEFEPTDAPAAAYGDPAIVVTCGVDAPSGFSLASSCESANGVGYYIPEEQYVDQGADVTITTAGYLPRVEVRVPATYRPNAVAAAMAALAPLVKRHLTLVEPCTPATE